MNLSKYPPNWVDIANQIKYEAGFKCERCGQPHDPDNYEVLTVQHLDRDTANPNAPMQALCQRCHMRELGTRIEFFRERERLGQLTLFNLPYKYVIRKHHI